jgi:2-iminobutanoate/2-iminopropanoate deaminase
VPNAAFLQSRYHAAPASNYVQAVEMTTPGRSLVISGQIGVTPDGQMLSGYHAQAEQAWRNALAGLAACNMQISDIVRSVSTTWHPGNVSAYREIRDRMLQGHAPASTYVIVAGLAIPICSPKSRSRRFRALSSRFFPPFS